MIQFLRYIFFCLLLLISVIILFPIVIFRPFNTKNSNILFKVVRKFCSLLLGMDINVEGSEILHKHRPAVVVANHQHTYDILAASALLTPFMTTLGKSSLGLIPIVGWYYYLSGNILIKRTDKKKAKQSLKIVEDRLKEKNLSVLIFPEGHRNHNKKLQHFKKGAFHIATKTGFPLIPVSIAQYSHLQDFNKSTRIVIHIKIHHPIDSKLYKTTEMDILAKKAKDIIQDGINELNKRY